MESKNHIKDKLEIGKYIKIDVYTSMNKIRQTLRGKVLNIDGDVILFEEIGNTHNKLIIPIDFISFVHDEDPLELLTINNLFRYNPGTEFWIYNHLKKEKITKVYLDREKKLVHSETNIPLYVDEDIVYSTFILCLKGDE